MIKGVHTMFYSSDAKALREFFRDKPNFNSSDVGDGWLIFDMPEADLGCHPSDNKNEVPSSTADISFYCDDIDKTVSELKEKDDQFEGGIADRGYGFVTYMKVPGNFIIQLHQPKYNK
jgi:hypothetical protein